MSRLNTQRTTALQDTVFARVKFTGRKVDYKTEYGLGFGDYVEAYDPKATLNNVMISRTEPCIVLYHSGNLNGSVILLNLKTNAYVCRSRGKIMVMSEEIINKMNALAGTGGCVTAVDIVSETVEMEDDVDEVVTAVHTPPTEPEAVPMTHDEVNIIDEEEQVEHVLESSDQDRSAKTPVVEELVESVSSKRPRRGNAGMINRDEQYD